MGYLYLFTLLYATFTVAPEPNATSLDSLSMEQAVQYIQQAERNEYRDLNLWALARLCESGDSISSYIDSINSYQKILEGPFCGNKSYTRVLTDLSFQERSPALLLAALKSLDSPRAQRELKRRYARTIGFSASSPLDYDLITDKYIDKETITEELLPTSPFRFEHYLLLFSTFNFRNGIIKEEYHQNFVKAHLNSNGNSPKNLQRSLLNSTLLFSLYLRDQYSNIPSIYSSLSEDLLIPVSERRLYIYRYLAFSMYRLGYYDRSLAISRNHTVPLATYLDKPQTVIRELTLRGVYLIQIGKYKEAQKVYTQLLEEERKNSAKLSNSTVFTNLGITYLKSGEFDRYLDLQLRALEQTENLDSYTHRLRILKNLFVYYMNIKDERNAQLYLSEARTLTEKYGTESEQGEIYLLSGTFNKTMENDFKQAEQFYIKAEKLLVPVKNYSNYMMVLFEKGKLFEETGQLDKALRTYQQIIQLASGKEDTPNLLEGYTNIGRTFLQKGKVDSVQKYVHKIQNANLEVLNFEDIIKAKRIEAAYYYKTGDYSQAYDLLRPVLDQTVKWAKNSTNIQSGFWNIEPEFLDAFQLMADLLVETGRKEEAVETLDRIKTINDASLYQNPMVKSSQLNEEELTEYRNLTQQLDALRKKQLIVDGDQNLEIRAAIDKLNAKKTALDRKISNMTNREHISIHEVQRQLGGREMVLHITELNNRYYLARITRRDIQISTIELTDKLRNTFAVALQNLATGKTDLSQLREITEVLNINTIPSRIESLTIIPDSYLYQLPIDILPLASTGSRHSYGKATYVVERYKTFYLTSLNDFRKEEPASRKTYKWDFAGYGVSDFQSEGRSQNLVPLPYAETEINSIMAGLTNVSDKARFLNHSSTEQTFKRTAPQSRILHLATHSELSNRDPLFSTIYMSTDTDSIGETNRDLAGRIFAYELFELNLANDLIMLNSCESGSGNYLQGTGVMGISRALRYAGANSLILNIWSVNDMMASDFAIEFYRQINEGHTKDEALRQAKLHFLKSKNANPHYWGSYMLIGDRKALIHPYREMNLYFAGSFMLYFIGLVSFSVFRKWKNGNHAAA